MQTIEHQFAENAQNTKSKGFPNQSLSIIIGSFKSAAKKRIHKKGLHIDKPIWQWNYYEHVIRDDEDYQRIVEYIILNLINWQNDIEFIPKELINR